MKLERFIWPIVIVVALILYQEPISHVIRNLKSGTLNTRSGTFGFEVAQAGAALVAAEIQRTKPENIAMAFQRVSDAFSKITLEELAIAPNINILWIDDTPSNNVLEMRAITSLGIPIQSAETKASAIAHLEKGQFDAIISDMSGWNEVLQELGDKNKPTIIYTLRCTEELKAELQPTPCADQPSQLFAWVNSILSERQS